MKLSRFDGTIVILGATGAVGQELLGILAHRKWPADRVRLVASENSAGQSICYLGNRLVVARLRPSAFERASLVLSATSSEIARVWLPQAIECGATVIDNSSHFRHAPGVPLVIPEVNGHELRTSSDSPRLVANPNCSTTLLLIALNPLRRRFGLEAIDVTTYQAVSGAGSAAIRELRDQTADALAHRSTAPLVFPEPCAFNVFSHESELDLASGLNAEEQKIIDETRRIFADSSLAITPTCVRVPVLRAHSQAVTVTLKRRANLTEFREAFRRAPGLQVVDNRRKQVFPTPLAATGQDEVLVGRFRPDPAEKRGSDGRSRRWCLFLSGDQLRKGAALNAIQVADLMGFDTHRANPPKRIALKLRSPASVFRKNGNPAVKH